MDAAWVETGRTNYHAGLAAEDQVADLYRRRGQPVARQRWRGRSGEIDLIAEDGEDLIFIEVKRGATFDRAAERLTHRQMRRVQDAALEYLAHCPKGMATNMRFDVALVNGIGEIRILENTYLH